MADVQIQMNKLVSEFVSRVTELAQMVAVDSLKHAFGDASGRTPALTLSTGKGKGKGVRAKRRGDELGKLQDTFVKYVQANPGKRIEEINAALGTSTKELQLPIRKLIAEGRVTTTGARRVTAYFAKKK